MQRLLHHPYDTALTQILPEMVNRQPGMQNTFRIALHCSAATECKPLTEEAACQVVREGLLPQQVNLDTTSKR